jgi:hypothetical protein
VTSAYYLGVIVRVGFDPGAVGKSRSGTDPRMVRCPTGEGSRVSSLRPCGGVGSVRASAETSSVYKEEDDKREGDKDALHGERAHCACHRARHCARRRVNEPIYICWVRVSGHSRRSGAC